MPATLVPPQQQQQQPPISAPPRVITTKDIAYLKDALSWELLAFKKFHFYAQQVQDPEISQILEKTGQMHQQHFQRLLPHLQVNNAQQMANMPQSN
ncbi:ferritin-like domain-containing protein [Brevibacillus fulvus]|uniref:Rubrerythrin family protein n=1 Tax=Brevibacillus fulvus TaxID=1125967 RepID=A0A938Y0D8_9BACL|nr:ferritin-like domain-containing protein [Brevibacillus fulvus]MBM7591056.1 hypothetical protein [Brevibacillus fulvus]